MTTKTDGGPAFPANLAETSGGIIDSLDIGQGGMTIRDYFAAKVCAALLTAASTDGDFPGPEYRHPRSGPSVGERVARISYQMADAMLAERNKS